MRRPAWVRRLTPRSGLACTRTFEAAVGAMTRVVETRDPDPATHAIYDELFREVYRRMYPRLKPLYRSIRRITGYPSA